MESDATARSARRAIGFLRQVHSLPTGRRLYKVKSTFEAGGREGSVRFALSSLDPGARCGMQFPSLAHASSSSIHVYGSRWSPEGQSHPRGVVNLSIRSTEASPHTLAGLRRILGHARCGTPGCSRPRAPGDGDALAGRSGQAVRRDRTAGHGRCFPPARHVEDGHGVGGLRAGLAAALERLGAAARLRGGCSRPPGAEWVTVRGKWCRRPCADPYPVSPTPSAGARGACRRISTRWQFISPERILLFRRITSTGSR